jgi:methyl-accepting chemotaxis protein/methyl-accepting chemotaxis protein-1 (serine sensor receptor)
MQNWTIGKKLFTGIGALLALIALTSGLGLRNMADLNSRIEEAAGPIAQQIEHAANTEVMAGGLLENALEALVAAHAKDRTKLEEVRKQTSDEVARFEKEVQVLSQVVDDESERQQVAGIKTALGNWKAAFAQEQTYIDEAKISEAIAVVDKDVKPASNQMVKFAKVTAENQVTQMEASRNEASRKYASIRAVSLAAILIGLLVAVVVVWVVRGINGQLRQIAGNLFDAAQQTTSAAAQVSSSSQALAQGSSEQAASLEETSASSEEISSMARKNTENSRVAAGLVTQSEQKFTETNHSLNQMVVAMNEINASSDKISKIIKVIDEIAFQTNILALNAAVEAARAGEAGMGFAVVADEVRNLAQRCAQAARDTASLIEESIAKSNDGKMKVDQVAVAIRSITEESARVKTLVDEVNLGSEEQARGIEQIGKAISQMEQVTQSTAASAEESASAAEQLNAQAVSLKSVTEQLTMMVGGSTANR